MNYKPLLAAAAIYLCGCPNNETVQQDNMTREEMYQRQRDLKELDRLTEEVKRDQMRRKEQIYVPRK